MANRMEPFSTHRPWDEITFQAYREQPVYNGWHFQLTEKCTPQQKAQWKEWMRKFPDHWPNHVVEFVDSIKRKQRES